MCERAGRRIHLRALVSTGVQWHRQGRDEDQPRATRDIDVEAEAVVAAVVVVAVAEPGGNGIAAATVGSLFGAHENPVVAPENSAHNLVPPYIYIQHIRRICEYILIRCGAVDTLSDEEVFVCGSRVRVCATRQIEN